jgi:Na+-translocating ferredoxin:NAD+ oxidoreductase RNF subunit RnfB
MTCSKRCPVETIVGGKNRLHGIDQEKCIRCRVIYSTFLIGSQSVTLESEEPDEQEYY